MNIRHLLLLSLFSLTLPFEATFATDGLPPLCACHRPPTCGLCGYRGHCIHTHQCGLCKQFGHHQALCSSPAVGAGGGAADPGRRRVFFQGAAGASPAAQARPDLAKEMSDIVAKAEADYRAIVQRHHYILDIAIMGLDQTERNLRNQTVIIKCLTSLIRHDELNHAAVAIKMAIKDLNDDVSRQRDIIIQAREKCARIDGIRKYFVRFAQEIILSKNTTIPKDPAAAQGVAIDLIDRAKQRIEDPVGAGGGAAGAGSVAASAGGPRAGLCFVCQCLSRLELTGISTAEFPRVCRNLGHTWR